MHSKIICITSSLEDNTCPIEEYDFDKVIYELGADYGGERDDAEETETYLQSMFGKFATIERIEQDDEDSTITHKLTLNKDAAVKMVDEWLTQFKQQIANTTLDDILHCSYGKSRCHIDKALDYDVKLENVVYMDCEFTSVIDFALNWMQIGEDTPLYVCGCVDYHW